MNKISEVKPVKQPSVSSQLMNIVAYVALALAILLFGIVIYASVQNKEAVDKGTEKTNELIGEVKKLAEENKKLNQTSNNYAYCNAVLLAKYTQTLRPISIEDLEKCILVSFPEGNLPSTTVRITNQSSESRSNSSNNSQSAPNTPNNSTPNTPNTPAQPNNNTKPLIEGTTNVSIPSILGLPGIKVEPCLDVLTLVKTC